MERSYSNSLIMYIFTFYHLCYICFICQYFSPLFTDSICFTSRPDNSNFGIIIKIDNPIIFRMIIKIMYFNKITVLITLIKPNNPSLKPAPKWMIRINSIIQLYIFSRLPLCQYTIGIYINLFIIFG